MLSKNQLKYFSSLSQKKFRLLHGRFLAEGEKIVREILKNGDSFLEAVTLIAEASFIQALGPLSREITMIPAEDKELRQISSLRTGGTAILELKIPRYTYLVEEIADRPCLFLNEIRDPGNLGTIIRTADWFGITDIFCSNDSVDTYNPKVVQASMGSLSSVRIHYVDPIELIDRLRSVHPDYKVTGTVLGGQNIYEAGLASRGLILFGNESQGLPLTLTSMCDQLVTIPCYGRPWAESLNVGIAAAIVCGEWHRRRIIQSENKA